MLAVAGALTQCVGKPLGVMLNTISVYEIAMTGHWY